MLYELVKGKPPFDNEVPTKIMLAHLSEPPPSIPGAPAAVSEIVMRALAKDPAERQRSCRQFAEECEAAMRKISAR
jgi:serine/threonine-protein kinase